MPKFLSADCKSLIKGILCTDPDRRFTSEDIRKHKWFSLIPPPVQEDKGLILATDKIPIDYDLLPVLS